MQKQDNDDWAKNNTFFTKKRFERQMTGRWHFWAKKNLVTPKDSWSLRDFFFVLFRFLLLPVI